MDNIVINIIEEPQEVTIVATGTRGPKGDKGDPGGNTTIAVTENIAAYELVNSDGSKASSYITGKRDWLLGIASASILSGFSGLVVMFGDITNSSWNWTAGNVIYLNGTALSTTPPTTGFIQMIGTAKSNHTIEIKIGQSILI